MSRTITIDHPKGQFEITRIMGSLYFDGPRLDPDEWQQFREENKAQLDKLRNEKSSNI